MTPFVCPNCREPLQRLPSVTTSCRSCSTPLRVESGVPILVCSPESLQAAVAASAAGRESWYASPHEAQLTGPYRHHLRKRRAFVESVIQGLDSSPAVIVDAGCGDGVNLRWLAPFAAHSYGTDYNIERLVRASRAAADGVALADLSDWPIADQSVDLIFCNHVLEHIPDDVTTLRELRRALRPGGTVILGVPNEGAAMWRFAYRIEPRLRRGTDHVHFYTATSLADRCRDAGFTVRQVEHIGWGVPSFTVDMVVRRFGIVDDILERFGRRWIPQQATSLYLILGRSS